MRRLSRKTLTHQNTIIAAKNFLQEMDNGATLEELKFISSAADDIALFWHLIGNPEEIPLQELQG
ncbi:hypothetical protein BZZ01_16900 [Nostocales cyanobacterium HT-58-2]|nr:hypothetical protein BZZ01_16900 [Nostocales cyanobacterium HT-58-2]